MHRTDYTKLALDWAAHRWCWTDSVFIEEMIDDLAPFDQSPIDFIDEQAHGADFDDPTTNWGIYDNSEDREHIADLKSRIDAAWKENN